MGFYAFVDDLLRMCLLVVTVTLLNDCARVCGFLKVWLLICCGCVCAFLRVRC